VTGELSIFISLFLTNSDSFESIAPCSLTNQGNRRAATGARSVDDTCRRVCVDRRVRRQAGVRCAQGTAERAEHAVGHWQLGAHDLSCVRLRENAGVCNTARDRDRAFSHGSLCERPRKSGNVGIATSTESQAFRKTLPCRGNWFQGRTLSTRQ
jgi:hypothetical protein